MVAAIMLIKMKRYVRVFKNAAAFDPQSAIDPKSHGVRTSLIFHKMVRRGILVDAGDGRYYLDSHKEAYYRKKRRIVVFLSLVVFFIGFLIQYLTTL